jgi:hypothetical protein
MIEFVNDKTWVVRVNDLGIELQPSEIIDITQLPSDYVVDSVDLKTTDGIFREDGFQLTYAEAIRRIKKITSFEHVVDEKTHAHNIRDNYFFDTEKIGEKTSKITYYVDATKTEKVREEEIVRDADGKVSQVVSVIYKNGVEIERETQTLNRGGETVDSISTVIED